MTDHIKRTVRSARWLTLTLLSVLVLGAWGAYAVLAASSPPPAPTLTGSPTNPSNVTSPAFSYTDSVSVTNFQCSLDGAAFVNCGSGTSGSTAYSGLANGSHTFRVQAFQKQGNLTSGQTTYTWTVDTVKPNLTAINRAGASPTNAASVSWTVTFSKPVSGVSTSNFATAAAGISGTSVTAVSPSSGAATSFTVTASTGSGTPSGSGTTLGLNLANGIGIKDAAQNTLATTAFTGQTYVIDKMPPTAVPTITSGPSGLVNSASATFAFSSTEPAFACKLDSGALASCTSPASYTGLSDGSHTFNVYSVDAAGNVGATPATRTWTVDTVPPTAPTLTTKPDDPNGDGIANFNWTASDPSIVATKCSIENGPFSTCPAQGAYQAHYIVDVSNDGTHQFAVAVYDAAGNAGVTTYKWKVLHGVNVTVDGDAVGLLYPGGPARPIALVLHNPNNFAVTVNYIAVSVKTAPAGCDASSASVLIQQSNVGNGSSPVAVTVPANTNLALPSGAATRPTIRLLDNGNQNACKNGNFTLSYLATGSK